MARFFSMLLLTVVGQEARADVLNQQHGLAAQLLHQLFGRHHFPITVLLIEVGVIALRRWRATRK